MMPHCVAGEGYLEGGADPQAGPWALQGPSPCPCPGDVRSPHICSCSCSNPRQASEVNSPACKPATYQYASFFGLSLPIMRGLESDFSL